MTIYELRDLLEHSDISDLPLRCSTYSRVSTEKETQAASLHNMTDDFRDYIERHKNWTFVKAFIDDGKSGLTTKKRKDFLNLLAAGAAGEYDLLVTGEISRFGRNTMEGLQNIQYLKDKGIPVIFLYDDLNTYDTDCDIQIQQKLVDAENESRKISKRVKRGHQKSIQKGHVLGCRMWGYKKVNCKLEIDEKTAPMVRRIFELYATNQYSMKEIEEIIFQEGYRNNNGNRLSHTTMSNIITNPKYKGYFVGGKVKVVDIFNKRQKFLPEEDWVMYKDEDGTTVPALVSEELWQAANEVFQRRSIDVKGRRNCSTHKNIYTGKLYCTEDGAPYYCKDVHYKGTNVSKWLCSHKINHGAASCRSIAIYESELSPIILDAFREFSKGADEILAAYLEQYRQVMDDTAHYKAERERIAKELSSVEKKQDQLLDMKVAGDLTLDEFKRMMDKTRVQKANLEAALDNMDDWEEIAEQMEEQVDRLKRALSFKLEDLEDGMITRDFVDNFIKRIDVTPLDNGHLSLQIHLLTDEIVQRELEKIRGRTGQLSKNIFPPAITAFATQSSAATIPVNKEACNSIGVPEDISDLVLPMGCTMHMDGSVLSSIVKIAFLYGIFDMQFTGVETYAMAIIVAILSAFVLSGAPGGGLVGEMLIVSMFNFPAEAFPIIATLGFIFDPAATCLNSSGDTIASMLVTRIVEGKDWLVKAMAAKKTEQA